MVSRNNHFTSPWIGPFFFRVRGTVRHDVFSWQKSYGEELFKCSSVMVEGTQLQMVGALDGMMFKDKLKRKTTCRFNLMVILTIKG